MDAEPGERERSEVGGNDVYYSSAVDWWERVEVVGVVWGGRSLSSCLVVCLRASVCGCVGEEG